MPFVSKAQSRLMHAAANNKGGVAGVPQSVAREFVAEGHGKKQGKLPDHKKLRREKRK